MFVVYRVSSGFCDEVIARSQDSHQVRLIVCDLETSAIGGLVQSLTVASGVEKILYYIILHCAVLYSIKMYSPPVVPWLSISRAAFPLPHTSSLCEV